MEDEIKDLIQNLDMKDTAKLLDSIDIKLDKMTATRIKNNIYKKAGIVQRPQKRILKRLLLIAAVFVTAIFCLGAAYYYGIGELFKDYFSNMKEAPLNQEEVKLLDSNGQMLQAKAAGEGYTVEISGIVGDRDVAYGYIRVMADLGQPMNQYYNFKNCYLRLDDDWSQKEYRSKYIMLEQLIDDSPDDNEVNFMFTIDPYIRTSEGKISLLEKEVIIRFQDFAECAKQGGIIKDLAYWDWDIPFVFADTNTTIKVLPEEENIQLKNFSYGIESIRLSPLSINIEGIATFPEDDKQASYFEVTIIQKDGTVIDKFFSESEPQSWSSDMPAHTKKISKNIIFKKPMELGTIKSIQLDDYEIILK